MIYGGRVLLKERQMIQYNKITKSTHHFAFYNSQNNWFNDRPRWMEKFYTLFQVEVYAVIETNFISR